MFHNKVRFMYKNIGNKNVFDFTRLSKQIYYYYIYGKVNEEKSEYVRNEML